MGITQAEGADFVWPAYDSPDGVALIRPAKD